MHVAFGWFGGGRRTFVESDTIRVNMAIACPDDVLGRNDVASIGVVHNEWRRVQGFGEQTTVTIYRDEF